MKATLLVFLLLLTGCKAESKKDYLEESKKCFRGYLFLTSSYGVIVQVFIDANGVMLPMKCGVKD